MKRLIFVDNYSSCSKLLLDLHRLIPNSSYIPLSIKFKAQSSDIYVVELNNVHEVVNRFNVGYDQVIGIGHSKSSYSTHIEYDLLHDYIVVHESLVGISADLGICRRPVVLPYGLHARQYANTKSICSSFKIGFDPKVRIPFLDVHNSIMVDNQNYDGLHVFICEDTSDIRTIHEAICAGAYLVMPYCEYGKDLSELDIACVIPNHELHHIDYSLSLVLEYIRTNPKTHILGSSAAYKYGNSFIDWTVTFPFWEKYFLNKALYKYD